LVRSKRCKRKSQLKSAENGGAEDVDKIFPRNIVLLLRTAAAAFAAAVAVTAPATAVSVVPAGD
jgi:hypothetical protein